MTEAKESTKRALPKTSIKSVQREIASLMIGEEMGIGHDPGQHAAYVGNWILCEDPKEILRASRDAEQINRYVLGPGEGLRARRERGGRYRDRSSRAGEDAAAASGEGALMACERHAATAARQGSAKHEAGM
jgi:antirestriction protein ArdC